MTTMVGGTSLLNMNSSLFLFVGLQGGALTGSPSSTQFSWFVGGVLNELFEVQGSGFTYDSFGVPASGTATSMTWSRNGVVAATFSNMSISIPSLVNILVAGSWSAFVDLVFSGADDITGSDVNEPGSDDTLAGWGGDDVINGLAGDDTISGDAPPITSYAGNAIGNDTLNGGAGNDIMDGGGGNDTLNGGDGNDQLDGGAGVDAIDGGAGVDSVRYDRATATGAMSITWTGSGGTASDGTTFANVEGFNFTTGSGADTLTLSSPILGFSAINAGAGDDHLSADFSAATGAISLSISFGTFASLTIGAGNSISLNNVDRYTITGGSGNDFMSTGAGNDSLSGGAGADQLFGGAGNNWLSGGAGDDRLTSGSGNDTLLGGDDNDLLTYDGGGVDIIDGGAGIDTASFDFSSATTSLSLSNADLTQPGGMTLANGTTIQNAELMGAVKLGSGSDTLSLTTVVPGGEYRGGAGFDLLILDFSSNTTGFSFLNQNNINFLISVGSAHAWDFEQVVVTGGSGGDHLQGATASDTLSGGLGNDMLRGNEGDDALNGGGDNDTLTGGVGNDVMSGGDDDDQLMDDTLQLTGGGNDQLDGGAGNDTLDGGGGNDILLGGDGNDFFTRGQGVDVFDGGAGHDRMTLDLSASSANQSIETSIFASSGGMTLTDGSVVRNMEQVTLTTGSGDDTFFIDATTGLFSSFTGGAGSDKVVVDFSSATESFNVSAGSIANPGFTYVVLWNVDRIIATTGSGNDSLAGFTGADELTAGAGNDTVNGGDGNDILDGGSGNDTINGGADSDTAVYSGAASAVTIDLALLTAQNTGGAGTDTLFFIENLIGSAFNDTLTGAAGANALTGNAGNDVLTGGSGDDVLAGGAGADTIDGGGEFDTATYAADAGAVFVQLAWEWARDGGGAEDRLFSIESVIGSAFSDVLIGWTGTTAISGGAGHDWIEDVGDGNDVFHGEAGNDIVWGGVGDDTLFGEADHDALLAGTGNDTIDGGTGNDWVYAGLGADFVLGGTGDDVLFGAEGGGPDANTDLADILAGGDGNDALIGEGGDDSLAGSFGDDWAYGGAGADLIDGGSGNDVLAGEDGNDVMTGAAGNDFVFGSFGDDFVDGGAGNDWVDGSFGNDTIIGGMGADSLFGGGGDRFVYTSTAESTEALADVIGVFWRPGGDRIDVQTIDADGNGANGNDAFTLVSAFSNVAGQMIITYDGTNSIARFDTNGDSLADMAIVVLGVELIAGDFIL